MDTSQVLHSLSQTFELLLLVTTSHSQHQLEEGELRRLHSLSEDLGRGACTGHPGPPEGASRRGGVHGNTAGMVSPEAERCLLPPPWGASVALSYPDYSLLRVCAPSNLLRQALFMVQSNPLAALNHPCLSPPPPHPSASLVPLVWCF